MGNMSYCRFENTVGDMRDCLEALNDILPDELSESEQHYRLRFIDLCVVIARDFGDEIE